MRLPIAFLLLLNSCFLFAQEQDTIPRKKITISRVEEAPKIDGILDDAAWKKKWYYRVDKKRQNEKLNKISYTDPNSYCLNSSFKVNMQHNLEYDVLSLISLFIFIQEKGELTINQSIGK